ncbi:MAG: hypothetical protein ABL957_13310 [Parvularculaceae bacterium]
MIERNNSGAMRGVARPGLRLAPAVIAAALMLGACTNVYKSQDMMSGTTDSQGVIYALPTTWLEISGSVVEREAPKGGPYQRIAVAEKVLPDASHVYSLDHAASAFAADEITIDVGVDQLLDKVHTKTKDVTDEIIISLAKSIAGVATFSIPKSAPGFEMGGGCEAPPAGAWTYTIDPYNRDTWPDWLKKGAKCLALTPIASAGVTFADRKSAEDCSKGICHRAPVPTRVEFDLGPAGRHEVIAGLLNKAPILSFDIDRTMFIEKKMNLTFDHGVISKVEIDRPSPALAAASLPLDVVKALLSAPTELFKLRVDYSTQAASDAKKEQEALEAQEALAKYLADQRRAEPKD